MADAAAAADPEEERRARLKAAGEAYFAKVLSDSKGRDALASAKPGEGDKGPASGPPQLPLDADFQQLGMVIETGRTYVLGVLLVAAQAVQLVFLKTGLEVLPAPGLLLGVHLVAVAATLWLLGAQGALELRPLSPRVVQAALPAALLTGLQTLFLFSATLHCGVFLVLTWAAAVPHLLAAVRQRQLGGAWPSRDQRTSLTVCAASLVVCLLFQFPGFLGLLLLLLWSCMEGAGGVWAALRSRPDVLPTALPEQPRAALRRLAEAEASLEPPTLALLRHALPALPALLLALVFGEGRAVATSELSVPAVTMMLLSVVAMTVSAASNLVVGDALSQQARTALAAAGPLGGVVTEAAVRGIPSLLAFMATIAAVLAGMVLRLFPARK